MTTPIRKIWQRAIKLSVEFSLNRMEEAHVGSIRIADFRPTHGYFVSVVRDALTWIAGSYPTRFARAKRHLRWIANRSLSHGWMGGQYDASNGICSVDFGRTEDPEIDRAIVAMVIVHEATHARLLALGIPYNAANGLRVEKLCCCEENRLATKLRETKPSLADFLDAIGESAVDEAALVGMWRMTRWQEWRAIQKRLREYTAAERVIAPSCEPASPAHNPEVRNGPFQEP